jgi:hypothetical protein
MRSAFNQVWPHLARSLSQQAWNHSFEERVRAMLQNVIRNMQAGGASFR